MSLRTDEYPQESDFAADRPANYSTLISIPTNKLAFVYASKRYFIPFGWYANPLPSTASTSWMLMLYYNFNPLGVNGDYSANFTSAGKINLKDKHIAASVHKAASI